MRESYNTPEGVYRLAKARGMDLVTITDHDQISGALSISHYPDVIVGCEVTGVFPARPRARPLERVRLVRAAASRDSTAAPRRARAAAVSQAGAALHVAQSRGLRRQRADHRAARGGAAAVGRRARDQQRIAAAGAEPAPRSAWPRRRGKTGIAGSDAHTRRGIGAHVDRSAGRDDPRRVHGRAVGRPLPASADGRAATSRWPRTCCASPPGFYRERFGNLARQPLRWQSHVFVFGGMLGLPLVALPLAGAYLHFVMEERFNRTLLYDLVRRPARALAAVPDLAA